MGISFYVESSNKTAMVSPGAKPRRPKFKKMGGGSPQKGAPGSVVHFWV